MKRSLIDERKRVGRKFPVRLLFTLARNKELRKLQIAVSGIKVGEISDLAGVMFPEGDFGWSPALCVSTRLGTRILKQYPNLAKVSLKGVDNSNYEKFVDRAIKKLGSKELEIRPAKK